MFQALGLGTEAPGRAQGLGLGFGLNPEVLEFAELCVDHGWCQILGLGLGLNPEVLEFPELCVGSQLVTEFGIGVKSLGVGSS